MAINTHFANVSQVVLATIPGYPAVVRAGTESEATVQVRNCQGTQNG